jgi:hypothetical protein
MASTVTLKASGLFTSDNELTLPEGALVEASNVVIQNEGIIESRRGYKLYGDAMPSISDRAKQLASYRERILRHFGTTLQYDDGDGNFTSYTLPVEETQSGLRIKFTESNGNLYFTTSTGIKKLSAKTSNDLSLIEIESAGAIKALDMTATPIYTFGNQSGFMAQDSVVAYRALWAKKDINNNLLRGTPSSTTTVYNSLLTLLIQDYLNVLGALDDVTDNTESSRVSDGDYVDSLKVPITADALTLKNNLVALAAKIDNDILLADDVASATLQIASSSVTGGVCTVHFVAGQTESNYFQVGDRIRLSGFTGIEEEREVVSVDDGANHVTFLTSAANGSVSLTSPTIYSNTFRSITQPSDPTIPTPNNDLLELQDYLDTIITELQDIRDTSITALNKTNYIDMLDITTSVNVELNVNIPLDIDDQYFLQIYRTDVYQATGVSTLDDIILPSEFQLVYEAYPTPDEITAGFMIVEDIRPDELKESNLYTNPSTGEGELQANDIPPFAKDINRFRNHVFYANTRTKQRMFLNLLGVDILRDNIMTNTPKLTISNGTDSNTYTFVLGEKESFDITVTNGASLVTGATALYSDIPSMSGDVFRFWFNTGTETAPSVTTQILKEVKVGSTDANTVVAQKFADKISLLVNDFLVTVLSNVVTVLQNKIGTTNTTTSVIEGTSPFTAVITAGVGEDALTRTVVISDSLSSGRATDETARSFVRVINANPNESIRAYYLSGTADIPGKLFFESEDLSSDPFYIIVNSDITSIAFDPDFTPENSISTISVGSQTTITSTNPHQLTQGDFVLITDTDATPAINGQSPLDGLFEVIEVLSSTQFVIDVNTSSAVNQGVFSRASYSQFSENEVKPNRIYYSKFSQPEAVPLVNYFDVGAEEKEILRIFPLRDSLFVFKEDGVYRVSGETAPFNVGLFDNTSRLIASDSLGLLNNLIFCWTKQGIVAVSEGGIEIISKPIDDQILKLGSSIYENFNTATFGVGYESDNSYMVWTVVDTSDEIAQICFRYSTLTGTWTTFDKSNTSAIVSPNLDILFLGAGDTNHLEEERKTFTRYDFADRELDFTLSNNKYNKGVISLPTVSGIEVGDVVVQEQYVSLYEFNMLLKKLDIDPSVADTNYESLLQINAGENLRDHLEDLADKLDLDTGVTFTNYKSRINSFSGTITNIQAGDETIITTSASHNLQNGRIVRIVNSDCDPIIDGDYEVTVLSSTTFKIDKRTIVNGTSGDWNTVITDLKDIKTCYNLIISNLNNDTGVSFSNYTQATNTTIQEAIITKVDTVKKQITLNLDIDFYVGDFVVYKSIKTTFTYGPNLMGDPINWKHVREFTLMFKSKALTSASVAFGTDLLPEFVSVDFDLDGNGIFGFLPFGTGFFGGSSNSAPFRTTIPRNAQRCRFISVKFNHSIAREQYKIFGITLTFENLSSTRAYR